MKNKPRFQNAFLPVLVSALLFALLFSGAHVLARQTPSTTPSTPCNDQAAANTKKDTLDFEPFADPAEVLRARAQKRLEEKNFKELQDAATQLASLSGKMSQEIDKGGQYAISLRVLDELNQIEKLTKKVRGLAK